MAVNLALVGVGKIARDQHIPALRENGIFRLAATVDPCGGVSGVPAFPQLADVLASGVSIDAVAICTPPGVRHGVAATALAAGLHVMLEKPPAATLTQAADLVAIADRERRTLFAAWHSREAAGVAPARAWLATRRIDAVRVTWHEDIRRWHLGQEWILSTAGYGVFDPGINALSILTEILPAPLVLQTADLLIPANRSAPMAARLDMTMERAPVVASFDFRKTGEQHWSVDIDTDGGTLRLVDGGASLLAPGAPSAATSGDGEYRGLYRRFAGLIDSGSSDVDLRPLQLVADAFLAGRRETVDSFTF